MNNGVYNLLDSLEDLDDAKLEAEEQLLLRRLNWVRVLRGLLKQEATPTKPSSVELMPSAMGMAYVMQDILRQEGPLKASLLQKKLGYKTKQSIYNIIKRCGTVFRITNGVVHLVGTSHDADCSSAGHDVGGPNGQFPTVFQNQPAEQDG